MLGKKTQESLPIPPNKPPYPHLCLQFQFLKPLRGIQPPRATIIARMPPIPFLLTHIYLNRSWMTWFLWVQLSSMSITVLDLRPRIWMVSLNFICLKVLDWWYRLLGTEEVTHSKRSPRHCCKCGKQDCKGKGGRSFCMNGCQDCGKLECKGRNSRRPDKKCSEGWS